jgi:hypothetical protein
VLPRGGELAWLATSLCHVFILTCLPPWWGLT